ncbi:MAG: hypothetical protein M0R17_04325 [Candidatus Omnitrophica bacterium]|jgi:hypothetical protein|nr:hypothetical protein [Candidatus Omnitrophota bacterium]
MTKQDYIFVRYAANPNYPDNICHKSIRNLVIERTKKFELSQYEEAWQFIMECVSPITKLEQILWAFPRKRALDLLQAMDELKSVIPDFICEELKNEAISDEDVENTLRNMKINEMSYSELIEIE